MGLRIICLDARRDLKLNPLQPPFNVPPKVWVTYAAELLVQVIGAPPRASKITSIIINQLYEERGVFNGSTDYPTLWDLYYAIVNRADINPQSRAAMVDSLKSLLDPISDIINYSYGFSSHDLSKINLILLLNSINERGKDLILNYLLLGEFASRIEGSASASDLWIAIDEANRICGAENSGLFGLADMISVVRGAGLILDLSAQNGALHPQILANTAKIIGRTSNYSDLNLIGRAVGLSREQSIYLLHHLNPGEFLMQLGMGKFRKPFLVRVPLVDFEAYKNISLPLQPNPLDNLKVVKAKSGQAKIVVNNTLESASAKSQGNLSLLASNADAKVMKIIADNPMLTLSELIAKSGMSSKTLIGIRKSLVAQKYIAERKIAQSGPGRNSIYFEPLKSGIEALTKYFGEEI
jgi:hypothetical protein